jgi:hypothetical protein
MYALCWCASSTALPELSVSAHGSPEAVEYDRALMSALEDLQQHQATLKVIPAPAVIRHDKLAMPACTAAAACALVQLEVDRLRHQQQCWVCACVRPRLATTPEPLGPVAVLS